MKWYYECTFHCANDLCDSSRIAVVSIICVGIFSDYTELCETYIKTTSVVAPSATRKTASTSTKTPLINKAAAVSEPDIAVIVPSAVAAGLFVSIIVVVVVWCCRKRGHCKCGEYGPVPKNNNSTNKFDTTGEFCNSVCIL